MAEKKKPVKKRSDEGRSVRKEDRKIVGKATRRELKKDAKRVVAGASMAVGLTAAGRGIKAAKAAKAVSSVKRLNPSKKTFGQINKEVSKAAKSAPKSQVKIPPKPKDYSYEAKQQKAINDARRTETAKRETARKESQRREQMAKDRKEAKSRERKPQSKLRMNYGGWMS